ncbi:activin receptor type-2A [Nematostella vectensis]|uniref:activin receptor type-2A n=1 Tax=Nematostella vectensis TaxID=45351 RepID=UPI00138FE656|nr:activin receptor type-2A [Nematostella vectensis]
MKRPLFWSFLALFCGLLRADYSSGLQTCESFGQLCHETGECNNTIVCNFRESHCYTLWENTTEGVNIIKKGCFIRNHLECRGDHQCLGTPRTKGGRTVFFCCCSDHFCNANFSIAPKEDWERDVHSPPITGITTLHATARPSRDVQKHDNLQTLLYSIVPIFGVILILAFVWFMYNHQKGISSRSCNAEESEPINITTTPLQDVNRRPIQLLEVVSQGQFGVTVWKAKYSINTVAVKIFPHQEFTAWVNERDFYKLCGLDHENVLTFIGDEVHHESQYNGQIYTEYWLITDFHENGSLSDFLKQRSLDLAELLQLASSVCDGLAYLHSDVPAINNSSHKPCIAHRDVKSKNILVKSDLTCCISDFGLALKFDQSDKLGETHGQVGTKRYMAPEVLEGAISFTRESFLRIDMYACGLVLWELLSRFSVHDDPVEDYRLPFEQEVGLHPSLEDMQQVVVQKKMRPQFKDSWRCHAALRVIIQTIEECWDQDGEARLTSHCVAQRLKQVAIVPTCTEQVSIVTPVINNRTTPPSRESSI